MNLFKLVTKNLLRRKIRFICTLLSISVAICAFVIMLAIGDNLRSEVRQQADDLGADIIVMGRVDCPFINRAILAGEQLPESIPRDIVEEIIAIPGIKSAVPYLTFGSSIQDVPVTLVGILPEEMMSHREWQIEYGSYFSELLTQSVIIGGSLASRFDLRVNDTLMFRGEEFIISGILQNNNSNDDISVFMQLDMAQMTFEIDDYVSFIAVTVEDVTHTQSLISNIRDLANLSVSTNEELLSSVLLILGSLDVTLQVIAGVSLIAAAFGIMNTMMTAIYERRREIGIMRAMGAKRHTVFVTFMLETAFYGFLGGAVGFFAGYVISRLVAPFVAQNEFVTVLGNPDTAVNLSAPLLFGVVGISMLIAVVSGLYPAVKASKLTPMEAIRNV